MTENPFIQILHPNDSNVIQPIKKHTPDVFGLIITFLAIILNHPDGLI